MTDDDRRAEIEAVRWATRPPLRPEDAEKVIAALDRVRDARDDEAGQRFWCPDCGASEIHHDWCEAFPGEPVVHGNREAPTARSPQGENHETARLRSALKRLRDLKGGDPEGGHIDADKVLLDLIDDDDIREAFEAISKWYG